MKRILLSVGIIASSLIASAQCDPGAYDWQEAPFGVSPNPQAGEQFSPATINVAYAEIIYVKAPTSASDIDETLPEFVMIDSLRLNDVLIDLSGTFVPLSTIGLNLTCNNQGHSPNPCVFLPGNAYCGDIAGTPNVSGTFPVKIAVTGFINFFGPQAVPYEFEGYTLVINGPIGITESQVQLQSLTVSQNSPNPAMDVTSIQYELAVAGEVEVLVINLVGMQVFTKKLNGKKGQNTYRLDTSALESGVYLYSITAGDKKFTRRMLVQH